MKIFVSHSRQDKNMVYNIAKILYRVGVQPFIAELEELGEQGKLTADKIKSEIQTSNMLAVWLTQNINVKNSTRIWVAYEIGVAHALNIPIWVFESETEFVNDYPIPHVDYYFIFNSELREDWYSIEDEMSRQVHATSLTATGVGVLFGLILGGPVGAAAGLIGGAILDSQKAQNLKSLPPNGFSKVQIKNCPVCSASYVVIARNERLLQGFPCPICRRYIQIKFQ